MNFYQKTIQDTLKELKTRDKGLTSTEAEERLKEHGPNTLPEGKKLSGATIFLSQFQNSLIIILIVAFIVSIVVREFSDAVIIAIAVVANIIFGFIQEYKAQKAFSALKAIITFSAVVRRDGKRHEVGIEDIVPGDLLVLVAGDRISADARIIHAEGGEVNEAALTGESNTVHKSTDTLKEERPLADRTNMVYSGTIVADGAITAIVTNTGIRTELGKIASTLLLIKEDPSPLQKKLKSFSKKLGFIILGISAIVFFVGVLSGTPVKEMFLTSVAIAVAALPEGLVVAVTVILAIGMQRILKQKALVRKLLAAETLGSTTVICTDKTGTLTKGEMHVDKILTYGEDLTKHSSQVREKSLNLVKALEIAALCNNAYVDKDGLKGSHTEHALLRATLQSGVDLKQLKEKYKRLQEIPFNSDRKFMATLHSVGDTKKKILFVKGAPDKLLPFISHAYVEGKVVRLSKKTKAHLESQLHSLTERGFRVLVGCFKDYHGESEEIALSSNNIEDFAETLQDLVFVGFYGLRDPIRDDVKKTLKQTKRAGITTYMMTGDHKLTAGVIAEEIGLIKKGDEVLEGQDLQKMENTELLEKLKTVRVFARVTPDDKLRLVRLFKQSGEIVAMTGDGVNDAPALKQADIGIALGSGTDVAKGASDLVLLKDNYSVIVRAIKEGRVIFDNIRKMVLYLLSDSLSLVVLVLCSIFLSVPLPLTAAQILWINLVTDGFPSFALTLEPGSKNVMRNKPHDPQVPVLDGNMKFFIILISGLTGFFGLALFVYFNALSGLTVARTVVFATLALNTLLYVFSVRSLKTSLFKQNFFSNKWLLFGVVGGIVVQLFALYFPPLVRFFNLAPLGAFEWTVILIESFVVIMLIEVVKAAFNKRKVLK